MTIDTFFVLFWLTNMRVTTGNYAKVKMETRVNSHTKAFASKEQAVYFAKNVKGGYNFKLYKVNMGDDNAS